MTKHKLLLITKTQSLAHEEMEPGDFAACPEAIDAVVRLVYTMSDKVAETITVDDIINTDIGTIEIDFDFQKNINYWSSCLEAGKTGIACVKNGRHIGVGLTDEEIRRAAKFFEVTQ